MSTNRHLLQRFVVFVLPIILCAGLLNGCGKKDAGDGTDTTSAGGAQTGGTSSGIHAGKTK